MAQPTKKQIENIYDYYSKELTELIKFITNEVIPSLGVSLITPQVFIYAALENQNCMLYKAINTYLNSYDIENIHDKIFSTIRTSNDGVIGGKTGFDSKMTAITKSAYSLVSVTKSKYITSDHILLSILSTQKETPLAKLFSANGVSYEIMVGLCKKVHDVISNDVPEMNENEIPHNTKKSRKDAKRNVETMYNAISQIYGQLNNTNTSTDKMRYKLDYCTSINHMCESGKIHDSIGMDSAFSKIYNILCRKDCNNALIVGENGVGKTQCVLAFAKQIYDGLCPSRFRNKEIWRLNPHEMIAGTQLRGMFENRVVNLAKQLKSYHNCILFIDNIESIADTAKGTGQDYNTGGLLDELLSNGEVQIIATITHKNYSALLKSNPDVLSKFQLVHIEKPSVEECTEILNGIKNEYEQYHHVLYADDIVKEIVKLSNKYITEKMLPSSAIDILDEIGAYKEINESDDKEINKLYKKIYKLKKDKDYNIKSDKIDEANSIQAEIDETKNRIAKISAKKEKKRVPYISVTMDDVYKTISEHTNIPISRVSSSEKENLKSISAKLKSVVIGQDEAIDVFARAIKRNKLGITRANKPLLSVMAIGQTGVGKTLIAKTLAKEIYGDEKYLLRFDMSEYSDETSINKLIGSNAGYIGYTDGGLLTEAMKKNKYCVLLIDEIEKANNKVYNLFLQILDDGFITDNSGYRVDFTNTIIIMTSNVGAKQASLTKDIGFTRNNDSVKEDVLKKELKREFPPEFLNRIDDIIYFNSLTTDNLREIIKLELGYFNKRINEIGYSTLYEEDVVDYILKDILNETEYGARPVCRSIRKNIENKITDLLVDNDYENGHIFKITISSENIMQIE